MVEVLSTKADAQCHQLATVKQPYTSCEAKYRKSRTSVQTNWEKTASPTRHLSRLRTDSSDGPILTPIYYMVPRRILLQACFYQVHLHKAAVAGVTIEAKCKWQQRLDDYSVIGMEAIALIFLSDEPWTGVEIRTVVPL